MAKTTAIKRNKELVHQEEIIQDGMKSFLYVGNALMKIRDERLYQEEHETFEEYCKDRWSFSRSYAHRLIISASVVENLLPIGNITKAVLPSNESQARALADSADDPDQQKKVWSEVVKRSEGKPITAKVIEQVADEILPPKVETRSKPDGKSADVNEPKRDKRTVFNPDQFENPEEHVSQFDQDSIEGTKQPESDSKLKSKIDDHVTQLGYDVSAVLKSLEKLMNEVDAHHHSSAMTNHKAFCGHYHRMHDELTQANATMTQVERAWRFSGK